MVFADAVILHFPAPDAGRVFRRVRKALSLGGVFALSVKRGEGESWSIEKLGLPRYFCLWQPEPLRAALATAGFDDVVIDVVSAGPQDWLMVTARALRAGGHHGSAPCVRDRKDRGVGATSRLLSQPFWL